jgi:hypothetical protein
MTLDDRLSVPASHQLAGSPGPSVECRLRRLHMADVSKCAHPACNCMVAKGGPWGKYCSEHCKEMGDEVELRCDCQHPECR